MNQADPGSPSPAASAGQGAVRAALPTWQAVLFFVLLYALLQTGIGAVRQAEWGQPLIDRFTVQPVVAMLTLVAPDQAVQAQGARLVWPGGALGVRTGCDGLEVMLLFAAAMLLAPLPARARLAWLGAGLLLLWAMNQGRVLALYAAFRFQRGWFDALHTLCLPLLLVGAAAGLYLWAVRQRNPA